MLSIDGPIYRILSFLYRCMVLNLLYLASCILIVTIPPATAALFAVARKFVYGDEPPIFRTFWRAFRENLKQSWIVAAVFLVVGWIVWVDMRVFVVNHWAVSGVAVIILAFIGLLATSTLLHIFPLMVHLEQTTPKLFSNAFKLNLIRPHLTLLNLIAFIAWYFIATKMSILILVLFFSVLAMITYWTADRKFKAIQTSQNLSVSDAAGGVGDDDQPQ